MAVELWGRRIAGGMYIQCSKVEVRNYEEGAEKGNLKVKVIENREWDASSIYINKRVVL